MDMGTKPFSIVAFHNQFFRQSRNAFVIGAYYPSLTGVCALGERILNHLVLKLRDYFKTSEHYKKVYRAESFDNWDTAIEVLSEWKVLRPETVQHFQSLKEIRNKRIHFDISTDYRDREYALDAIRKMNDILNVQFAGLGRLPWFIPNSKGAFYIKKEFETDPFVKEIYLPNCVLVTPKHRMEYDEAKSAWNVINEEEVIIGYETREFTDEEFLKLTKHHGQA